MKQEKITPSQLEGFLFKSADILRGNYEYLIKFFADSAGKKGGEFYTPGEVVRLLVQLTKPENGMEVYDPTIGSGGFLIQTHQYIEEQGQDPNDLFLAGPDSNGTTWAICNMNLILHNITSFQIENDDTPKNPMILKDGTYRKFDRVLANPPFSQNYSRAIKTIEKHVKDSKATLKTKTDELEHKLQLKRLGGDDFKIESQELIRQVNAQLANLNSGNKDDKKKITALYKDKAVLESRLAKTDGILAAIGDPLTKLEVWNPGTLSPPLTIAKLRKPHGSVPCNPLLAESLYLTKYIERMGTGTGDMIKRCRDVGLEEPEFALTDGFVVTIRRKPELAFKAVGGITGEVTGEVQKLLTVLVDEMKRTDIQEALTLRHEDYFRAAYLIPALTAGMIEMTIPNKPTSSKQKYRLTEKGHDLLAKQTKETDADEQ